ncbi:cytidylyltransferase domain-containing protein [Algoriphagus limi]|uniref:Acylneuraminate cytidylyltransferase family protein n=1 Tax=Algoriphagus limi TaxID=2975273 RepID=A0ABT2G1X6_9BACT|nr:acylneuraminate cytidylyltransferase family protein [Algoriphagus limi]MCS5489179.1 acylneuraminate cytidylyltransferase family protein [Algoriphagus limi]
MITAFVPCRKGSERVKNKNTRPFAGVIGGLVRIKLEQLIQVRSIDQIVLSTNDEEVKAIGRSLGHAKIKIVDRPENLATSSASTDDLITYVPSIISAGTVLWTHVTSPFIGAEDYDEMIEAYQKALGEGHDSLMTVTKWQKFLWNEQGPVNYDRDIEKWPRTQTLQPLYEIDSGAFITDISVYQHLKDRVGQKPKLFLQEQQKSFDIDWEEDFKIAEYYWKGQSHSF